MKHFFWGGNILPYRRDSDCSIIEKKELPCRRALSLLYVFRYLHFGQHDATKVVGVLLIIFCVLFNNVFAQSAGERAAVKAQQGMVPLRIGDKVPDEVWNITHQTLGGKTITLSDYKDKKLIILDFWATWCGGCIGLLPKMDSIQRELSDDLVVLPVTTESTAVISSFSKRRSDLKMEKSLMTYITGSTTLPQLFPHGSLPHYVWIKEGKVYAISAFDAIDRNIIRKVVTGEDVLIHRKHDYVLKFDRAEPFLFNKDAIRGAKLFQQSALVGYVEGAGSGYVYTVDLPEGSKKIRDKDYRRITAFNLSMVQLFQLSFSDNKRYFDWDNTEIRAKKGKPLTTKVKGAGYLAWMRDSNTYCYELILPTQEQHKAWGIMQSELHKYFDQYKAYTEKQVVPAICLIRTSDVDRIKSKGGEKINTLDATGGRFNQHYLSMFVGIARDKAIGGFKKPVLNLTNYPYPVDIKINAKMNDIEALNKALAKYDLKFVEQDRQVEVLVIDDKNSSSEDRK